MWHRVAAALAAVVLAIGGLTLLTALPAAADADINGEVTAADPVQTGRLFRNIDSSCAAAKPNPGLAGDPAEQFHYDSYNFTGTPGECVTVTLTVTSEGGNLLPVVYEPSFNPLDPSQNYVADAGVSDLSGGTGVTFSFRVPNSGTFALVVSQAPEFLGLGTYNLKVVGASQDVPPANAICVGIQLPPPNYNVIVAQPGVPVVGTAGNDFITGTPGSDRILGQGGDDIVFGRGGNDQITGGGGHERICGGTGDDQLYGDDGNDMLSGDDGNDTLDGVTGGDSLFGGSGIDRLHGGAGTDNCAAGGQPGDFSAPPPSCDAIV